MNIDRSKHNKYSASQVYTPQKQGQAGTEGGGSESSSGGKTVIIYQGGGGGSIDPELLESLKNQDAYSYFNLSDGTVTINSEAKQEKDHINLSIIGDNDTVETKVSVDRGLKDQIVKATGQKPGTYSITYEKITVTEIVDNKPVDVIKWRLTIKKVFGDPLFASSDFSGIAFLLDGVQQGEAISLSNNRVVVTSDSLTGLQQIIITFDDDVDFDCIQFVKGVQEAYAVIVSMEAISVQNFNVVQISQAGATRFWKLDADGNLYTDYVTYVNQSFGAKDRIWTNKGIYIEPWVQGVSGAAMYIADELGTTYAEVDKLRVRKKAYFETLEIVNVNSVGGKQIISPGGAITIRKVEEFTDYYRCYFLGEQDGVEIENRFKVDDQAFSQNFNIKKPGNYEQVANHYFWRLVVGVSTNVDADGNHYIDLSKTDFDTDSDIPHVNDVVAQLGNRTDTDRQSALIFSSVDVESPRLILCHGINHYTLNATSYFDVGVDHSNNQAYMNVYGNSYIGAKDQSSYIDYSIANGLTIKGNITITSTYGGKTFDEIFVTTENISDTVKAIVGDDLTALQNQIDGNIESYFYDYSPTLSNYPAVDWTTEDLKQRHNGDTFTNIQEFVDDATTPDAGKSWRWVKNDSGVWGWIPISDSDAVLALKKAGQAQDTADGKRRVFTKKPEYTDEYDVGDLWVNATFVGSDGLAIYTNDLLRANTAKKKGDLFDIAHWGLASKYTDDTLAQSAKALADAAQEAANKAGTAATTAQNTINSYKTEINNVFQDGVITTSEKNRLNSLKGTINTTLFDVQMTYNGVKDNEALKDKTQKAQLERAYTEFSSAATTMLNTVDAVLTKAGDKTYVITKGDVSSVDNAYANFNTKYTDYVAALSAANLEIMNTIGGSSYANAVEQYAWLHKLFDPEQQTQITGGLVATGMLALGLKSNGVFKVNAGMNGAPDPSNLGNSPAIWFGGDMKDVFTFPAGSRPSDVATSMFRYDGSGYLGYNASTDEPAIWWDNSGNIHANPLSFFVGPQSVGFLLSSFQPVDTNGDGRVDYIVQQAPFQSIRIGDAYLGYDSVNNAVYVYKLDGTTKKVCNFYSYGDISAYGSDSGQGGGGLDADAMWDILGLEGTQQIHPSHVKVAIDNALAIYSTTAQVTQMITDALAGNATQEWVNAQINSQVPVIVNGALNGYATQAWVNEQLKNVSIDTSDLVTISTDQNILSTKTFAKTTKFVIPQVVIAQAGIEYHKFFNQEEVIGFIGAATIESDGLTGRIGFMQVNPYGGADGVGGLVVGDDLGFNGHKVFHSGNTVIPSVPNIYGTAFNENINYANRLSKIQLIACNQNSGASYGYPAGYYSGIHIGTNYTGFQLVSYGGTGNDLRYRNLRDTGQWESWVKLLHTGNYTATLDNAYVRKIGDTMTGLLNINTYGIIVTIGAQNSSYAHIQNNVGASFYFNNSVLVDGNLLPYDGVHYLGDSSRPWGDIYYNGWIRQTGDNGVYWQKYGGGFNMTDSTWIRTYGNKSFLCNGGDIKASGIVQGSYFRADSTTLCPNLNAQYLNGYGISNFIYGNTGRGTTNITSSDQFNRSLFFRDNNSTLGMSIGIFCCHSDSNNYAVAIGETGYTSSEIAYKIKNNGTWGSTYAILSTANYASYIDGRYVNASGDTMTGTLRINNGVLSAGEYQDDSYGYVNVTRPANINGAYFSMVRSGTQATAMGLTTDGYIWLGTATSSKLISDYYAYLRHDNAIFHGYLTANYMTCRSTTLCTNLNADYLDGYHRTNLFSSFNDMFITFGSRNTITVAGDANTYYPVVISPSGSKTWYGRISVWKNLGSPTNSSYPGNHSNGTSSLWIMYEGRSNIWDGNGGFYRTVYNYQGYATLVAKADAPGSGKGDLVVYLRGGGTEYTIDTDYKSSVNIYYSKTNLYNDQYPWWVEPTTTVTNGGRVAVNDVQYIESLKVTYIDTQRFRSPNIAIESDYSWNYRSHEINDWNDALCIQYNTSQNLILCYGGGKVGIQTNAPAFALQVNSDSYVTGWSRIGAGIYFQAADNYFTAKDNRYMSLDSMGQEICIAGGTSTDIHVNYRTTYRGYAPKTWYWRAGSSGSWATMHMGSVNVNGNLVATAEITAYSDVRLKSDIHDFKFRGRLRPKTYIKDGKKSIGFIAQEVQILYPELVMEGNDENHYLSLNYAQLTSVISAQVNDIEDEVIKLKNRVKELENKLKEYEPICKPLN